MFPVKMIYQPTAEDAQLKVTVYSIQSVANNDFTSIETLVTAWSDDGQCWITAPIWCFKPVKKQILKEGI